MNSYIKPYTIGFLCIAQLTCFAAQAPLSERSIAFLASQPAEMHFVYMPHAVKRHIKALALRDMSELSPCLEEVYEYVHDMQLDVVPSESMHKAMPELIEIYKNHRNELCRPGTYNLIVRELEEYCIAVQTGHAYITVKPMPRNSVARHIIRCNLIINEHNRMRTRIQTRSVVDRYEFMYEGCLYTIC